MSRQYKLSPEAHRQIDEIGAFIARDSVESALKVLDALEDGFELLAAHPELGHTRNDLTTRPLKFWNVFSYLVIYEPANNPLQIITVVHGARDVASLLTDDR